MLNEHNSAILLGYAHVRVCMSVCIYVHVRQCTCVLVCVHLCMELNETVALGNHPVLFLAHGK